MQVSRRGVVIGALAGGGLVVGYLMRPRRFPIPLQASEDEVAFDAWIKVSGSGIVTVAVPQLEMGQGVTTLIPQIVAWEMGADWRQIAVEPAPPSPLYANLPLAARWSALWMPGTPALADEPDDWLTRRWAENHRFDATADGQSLAAYEEPARAAAASARALLTRAAATRWSVAEEECEAQGGFIVHGDKRLPFGELATEAAAYSPPDPPPLRPSAPTETPEDSPPGAPMAWPRLDLPAKVDGTWQFAGDVRLPDMVFASIRHGPISRTARLADYDADAAKGMRGKITLVRDEHWLAAVADDWWSAETALSRIAPAFAARDRLESSDVSESLDSALRTGKPHVLHTAGEPDRYLRGGLPLQLRYEVSPALHATIETASATARISDGKLELWVATQVPEATREAAAKALGIALADVVLYPMPAGGSFDRRLEFGHAVEAARIARACGRPVQLTWSRAVEHLAGWPRTPAAALMSAAYDTEGGLAGWRARIAVPPAAREFGRRLFDASNPYDAIDAVAGEADPMALEGAVPAYDIAHVEVAHVPARIALPTARMRGNAHGYTAFFTESFIDEIAHAANREPLAFRMGLLGNDPRLAECLQRVSTLASWGGGGDSSGQGIACHAIDGGRIAVVVSARRSESGVRVDRISAVADIGRIVNLDIARQQIEGGLVFGLGLALGSSTDYFSGLPTETRLGGLGLPTLADCPEIAVEFITSDLPPADPGELGVAAIAPALANALYSATGLRFRRLPLLSEEL